LVVEIQAKASKIPGGGNSTCRAIFTHHPKTRFQLQLESAGGLFLDLFNALNPAVVSILP
jgi:hypothetical protein